MWYDGGDRKLVIVAIIGKVWREFYRSFLPPRERWKEGRREGKTRWHSLQIQTAQSSSLVSCYHIIPLALERWPRNNLFLFALLDKFVRSHDPTTPDFVWHFFFLPYLTTSGLPVCVFNAALGRGLRCSTGRMEHHSEMSSHLRRKYLAHCFMGGFFFCFRLDV